MKILGKITSKKEHLQINNYSVNDFKENHFSSTNTTINHVLKERDLNKMDSIGSPTRSTSNNDDAYLKQI